MTGDECASAVRCDADGEQKIKEDDVAAQLRDEELRGAASQIRTLSAAKKGAAN